jgi:hypothetical protein
MVREGMHKLGKNAYICGQTLNVRNAYICEQRE